MRIMYPTQGTFSRVEYVGEDNRLPRWLGLWRSLLSRLMPGLVNLGALLGSSILAAAPLPGGTEATLVPAVSQNALGVTGPWLHAAVGGALAGSNLYLACDTGLRSAVTLGRGIQHKGLWLSGWTLQ